MEKGFHGIKLGFCAYMVDDSVQKIALGRGNLTDAPVIYTVEQTSGWEGRELMKPFDVFISKDGNTYRYLINNANFESYIKVVFLCGVGAYHLDDGDAAFFFGVLLHHVKIDWLGV